MIFLRGLDNTDLDPAPIVQYESVKVVSHIFETLFATSDDGQEVIPWLATGYDLSDDFMTYTVHLREGVLFSNGDPMTATDVKFSLDRAIEEAAFGFLLAAIDNVEVVDENTVVIETSYPWAPLPADLALWSAGIMPADFAGMDQEAFFENPIGTGPFMLDEWDKGTELRVVRNPNYWQEGKPYLDSVTWKVVPDANTQVLQLESGDAHIITDVPLNLISSLDEASDTEAGVFPGGTLWHLPFNTTTAPFDDGHVRRAIAHAIDRDAITEAVSFGFGVPTCALILPSVWGYDPNTPCLENDLDMARAELSLSAYPDGFATEFLVANTPLQVSIAEAVQAQIAEIGIDATIKLIDPGQFYETLSAFNYEMALTRWRTDIPDPDEQVSFMLDPELGGGDSYSTGYNNPDVIALVREAQQEFDVDARLAIYAEIQAIHAQENPQTPILFVPEPFAWRANVRGFFVNGVGDRHLENVWLE